ncbi:MAG: hypothetical protein JWO02_1487 [Solirubrobacterales bacterium]|nr:hypothetical protein [Solirubrobacterales bacterium]
MSFFDDEPTRAAPRASRPAARPRTPAGARPRRPAGGGSGGSRSADDQTLLIRRLVAGGIGVLVLVLLVVGINGCLNSRTDRALRDYTRNVASVMATSQSDVATPLFQLLNSGADNPGDLQASVSQYRVAAEEEVKQASGFSVPDQMTRAQSALMLVLHLRATAIAKIADRIPVAQATGRDNAQNAERAVREIAGQMRAFDASDVIYSQRTVPYIQEALKSANVSGAALPAGQFLPDVRWLNVDDVAGVLGSVRASGGTGANPQPAPGLHGHGVIGVSVGSTPLSPQPAINRVSASGTVTFNVKIANQGDNNEQDVKVRVTVKAGTAKPITATKTVTQTKAKSEATVAVPLTTTPPRGTSAVVTVEVLKVPGEKNLTNNKMTYTVLFQP